MSWSLVHQELLGLKRSAKSYPLSRFDDRPYPRFSYFGFILKLLTIQRQYLFSSEKYTYKMKKIIV